MMTRWNPWAPLSSFNQLQNEVNRIFDRFDAGRPEAVFPPINVWEQGETYHVEAELPGFELSDLEITVAGASQLTIKGRRKPSHPEDATPHRRERIFGEFVRGLTLPTPLDADKVEARLENGVLHLALPKHEAAKPRKIAIKS